MVVRGLRRGEGGEEGPSALAAVRRRACAAQRWPRSLPVAVCSGGGGSGCR